MQAQRHHALIVHGGLEMHEPQQGATKIAEMLSSSGVDVTVTED